jgi:hypothetical protein
VVPGYPPFSAAIEMTGITGWRTSADDLRAAINPHLQAVIDHAARMLLLLVDRLPNTPEAVRRRLATLLLRTATLGLRRDQVMEAAIVRVREGEEVRMATPREIAAHASSGSGVVPAVEPKNLKDRCRAGWRVEATAEERSLLSELLGVRVELTAGSRPSLDLWSRLTGRAVECWRELRGLAPPRPLASHRLEEEERRFVDAAAAEGIELGLCPGSFSVRTRGRKILIGRQRPEVVSAIRVFADDCEWLYPALLATVGSARDLAPALRRRWLAAVSVRRPGLPSTVGSIVGDDSLRSFS